MMLFHARRRRSVALLAARALEAAEAAAAERHLARCEACREDFACARAVLDLVARDPVHQAEPILSSSAVAARVRARIEQLDQRRPVGLHRSIAVSATAAAALAVALVALRMRPVTPLVPHATPTASVAVADASDEFLRRLERHAAREQAARYLDEAGDVLVTVSAQPRRCRKGEERVEVREEARKSRDLLARRRLLLDVDPEVVAIARPVLDDVEQVLREVASLESCARKRDLESINRQIERRRLLLKIDLMARELQG
jgi:hypothetical protein